VAARYVHQMADEVINQLAGVAAQLRTMRANGPEKFQNLLDEWNENFPEALGAYGTPKNVAAMLLKQTAELQQLRNELEKEKIDRGVEISQILKSVDAQLYASCAGVMSERRQQSLAQQQQHAEFEKREQTAGINAGATIQSLRESYDASIAKIQLENKKLNRQYARKNELLKTEINAVNTARSIDKIEAEKIIQSEREAHHKSSMELQEQIKSKESPVTSPLRRNTQVPPKSPWSRTSRDVTNSKTNESSNENVDSRENKPSGEVVTSF
jgi:molybdopterin converting factor small subunit